jgi:hypothetical protein
LLASVLPQLLRPSRFRLVQVAVVEASHRTGGRVHTWRSPTGGALVDTGAQWIENEGADGRVNPIYALTKELGIPTVPNKCVPPCVLLTPIGTKLKASSCLPLSLQPCNASKGDVVGDNLQMDTCHSGALTQCMALPCVGTPLLIRCCASLVQQQRVG